MWFHNLDGRLYLTGTPGTRDLYANLVAHSEFTVHLKGTCAPTSARRPARSSSPDGRRAILARLLERPGRATDLEAWVRESPLVEVELLEPEGRLARVRT